MYYSKSMNGFYNDDYEYSELPDDLIEVTLTEHETAIEARAKGGVLDVIDGQLIIMKPAPSPAHEAINGEWGLNQELQDALDAERDAEKRTAFQAELDERMSAAVSVASALDYANKRKALPADKAARLNKFNVYLDQLTALEYSDPVVWPVQPE